MSEVITIDCHYLDRSEFAAAYLLIDGSEAAFVDNNTNRAVPALLAALESAGLAPEQVRYLIVTHVHLDHAGGTAALAAACPNATVIAHPRAVPHLTDPASLIAGATEVYGQEQFARLYGRIEAVPARRVRELGDEETLAFGGHTLRFLHTRGHANHHFCILEAASGRLFTGDAFGLHYPALQADGTFAVPSTSPTGFDAELARQSVRRLAALAPAQIFPTHFGAIADIPGAAAQLIQQLDFAEEVLNEVENSDLPDQSLKDTVKPRLQEFYAKQFAARPSVSADPANRELLELDIELNAQGIAFAAVKRRRKARMTG